MAIFPQIFLSARFSKDASQSPKLSNQGIGKDFLEVTVCRLFKTDSPSEIYKKPER
jgi:hypothetical protein